MIRCPLPVSLMTLLLLGAAAWAQDAPTPAPRVIDASSYLQPGAPDAGLQAALDAAAKAGGGVVELPAGRFALRRYLYLPSNVTLRGQGDQTVLTLAQDEQRADVVDSYAGKDATIKLAGDLSTLHPGVLVELWPNGPQSHHVHRRRAVVQRVEGDVLHLEQPFGYGVSAGRGGFVSWGMTTRVSAAAAVGAQSITVDRLEVFQVGDAITLTGAGDVWNHHFNYVTAIAGPTLTLHRPLTVAPAAGSIATRAMCMITADGEHDLTIENLTIAGFDNPRRPGWGNFYLAGIHTVRCRNITVRHVTIRHWYADAFSFQQGEQLTVEHCTALHNGGHGFHPGTGWTTARFAHLLSEGNGGDGLYFCWHNKHITVCDSRFIANGNHGIGGLGTPGDRHNLIENNLIADNGRSGVEITGGPDSGNVVRGNTVRDNSRSKPGAWPGILLTAGWSEGSTGAGVLGNTIQSTLEQPTQWVGIEERHAKPMEKNKDQADPTYQLMLADRNRIADNQVAGHRTADILVRGPHTELANNTGQVQQELPTPVAQP